MKRFKITNSVDPAPNRNRLLEMLDYGIVNGDSLARELLQYLSDYEVGEFIRIYEYERPEDIEECDAADDQVLVED